MILLILSYSPPLIVATLPCASYPSPPLIVATLPAPPASNKSNSARMPLLCRQYQFRCTFAPFIHHLLPARVSIKSWLCQHCLFTRQADGLSSKMALQRRDLLLFCEWLEFEITRAMGTLTSHTVGLCCMRPPSHASSTSAALSLHCRSCLLAAPPQAWEPAAAAASSGAAPGC